MVRFCPIASGSKGNCLFVETGEKKVLIDAGISAKKIVERLHGLGVDPETIDALLITHEHSDHVKGVETFVRKYKTPVFSNRETAKALLDLGMKELAFTLFTSGELFHYGDMDILPFNVQHDTLDPVAFLVKVGSLKLGICADLGFATSLVKNHLKECDLLYIESNHEPAMVHACARPHVYKTRVLGKQGHLSNDMCCALLDEVQHPGLKKVYLAHLSEECNNPKLAYDKAQAVLRQGVELSVAEQHVASRLVSL